MSEVTARKPLKASTIIKGMLIGSAITIVVFGIWLAMQAVENRRQSPPLLTEAALDAAEARWQERGPESYDLDVLVIEGQPGNIHVEIRDGEATAMTRNGIQPALRRTWDVWSIAGQFDMIRQEWEKADDATKFGAPAGAEVRLHAEFDPELGYPRRYLRTISGGGVEVRWEVVRLVPVAD